MLAFGCGSAGHAVEAARSPKPDAPPPPSAGDARAESSNVKGASSAASGSQTPDSTAQPNGAASTGAAPSDEKPSKPESGATPTDSDEKGSPKPREITFQMTPGGLVIEVEGVRLEPKAAPLRLEDGWGVRLIVRATATDGHVHRFTRPEHGPLMVAAEIDRKGKKERVGDERKGDGEDSLTQGTPITLERDFKKPIWSGQSVTLFVGLWGLGRDTEERRLVRKLFVVKMVAGNKKPIPVVSPPE